jgi:radical SAM family uncharacterized protein
MDVVAFSLTHELCYTNVLLMLDLSGIPLRSAERLQGDWPLVIAGGGCAFNAEPVAPFLDLLVLGDGEEVLPQILEQVELSKEQHTSRVELLRLLSRIPGVYVPSFFEDQGAGRPLRPLYPDHERVEKRVVADLDRVDFPTAQIVPHGKVVHDRLTLEIARGCTRGCRFCQAGMLYRPVRERSLPELHRLLEEGLGQTGFEEVSFLSLSTGDFSALTGLFEQSISRCSGDQISISLPSLRVGSLHPRLMSLIASIRRTGVTLAPEAGSQRLRDVINKGITEDEFLEHVTRLFSAGWQVLKLYFMIGLPTETREDLDAIVELCLKVQSRAGAAARKGKLQINVALSPFVPKPHTPFQWERQLSRAEVAERLDYLKERFRPHRRINLKWHDPDMSFLEGVFSRGDRALAPLVERAYREGALFSSWVEHLRIDLWKRLMAELGIDPQRYLGPRDMDGPLPWDHLDCGVDKHYLQRECRRALGAQTSPDCRYGSCLNCGVCTSSAGGSRLTTQASQGAIEPVLNRPERDQDEEQPWEGSAQGAGQGGAAAQAGPSADLVREARPGKVPEPARPPEALRAHLPQGRAAPLLLGRVPPASAALLRQGPAGRGGEPAGVAEHLPARGPRSGARARGARTAHAKGHAHPEGRGTPACGQAAPGRVRGIPAHLHRWAATAIRPCSASASGRNSWPGRRSRCGTRHGKGSGRSTSGPLSARSRVPPTASSSASTGVTAI